MTKFTNPTKVITGPNTRFSYANVWEAKSINGGAPKFSVSLIIPKSDTRTVEKIKAAIEAAYKEGRSASRPGRLNERDLHHLGAQGFLADNDGDLRARRSEERRVGKECRSRWSPYH